MRDNNSSVILNITGPDAKAHFKLTQLRHRDAVEEQMSPFRPVEWRLLPTHQESNIKITRASTPSNPATWPELNAWMAGGLEAMDALFRPIVKTLNAADLPPELDEGWSDPPAISDNVQARASSGRGEEHITLFPISATRRTSRTTRHPSRSVSQRCANVDRQRNDS